MANIRSLPRIDKYRDFKKFKQRNPNLTAREAAAAYHVSLTTVYLWLKKLKEQSK